MFPKYKEFSKLEFNESDKKYLLYHVKRMLPEYIFDIAQLEGNPFTFPEVQTLLDGITVGGHKLSDEQQILNLKSSWQYIMDMILGNSFELDMLLSNNLHSLIAKNEALIWGEFRDGNVSIAGTQNYICPKANELAEIFNNGIDRINEIQNPIEKAIITFLFFSYNQFYYDGNKRTGRLLANGILLSEGFGVFNVSYKDMVEFNALMVEYYDSCETDRIIKFLIDKCIVRIKK